MRQGDKNLEEQKAQPYHLAQEGGISAAQRGAASLSARDRRPLAVRGEGERTRDVGRWGTLQGSSGWSKSCGGRCILGRRPVGPTP
jgi:hypothetical protein